MANISLNNHKCYVGGGTATTISTSFEVFSGTERGLYVCMHGNNPASFLSATYNGIALTSMSALTSNSSNSSQWYVLLDPPVGTFNIVFNYSAAQFNALSAIALNNVDQTSAVLDTPHQTQASSGSNPNVGAWCGDLPNSGVNRPMYMITGAYSNGLPSFVYDTSFDFALAFSSRVAPTNEFVDANAGGIGIAGWGRLAQGASWKASVTHNWGGSPPAAATTYLFINENINKRFCPADVDYLEYVII